MKRVLFVDDEVENYSNLFFSLKRRGYEPLFYKSGNDAMRRIYNKLRYDIAVFDMQLQDIGGDVLIEASRTLNEAVPIIVASGYEYLFPNTNALIRKPYTSDELINLIDIYLDPTNPQSFES